MNLYVIDCEIEQLENDLDFISFNSEEDFITYIDKILQLIQLKVKRNNLHNSEN